MFKRRSSRPAGLHDGAGPKAPLLPASLPFAVISKTKNLCHLLLQIAQNMDTSQLQVDSPLTGSCLAVRQSPRPRERQEQHMLGFQRVELPCGPRSPQRGPRGGLRLAGCGKKDFRRLLPLSDLSPRKRRLRKDASFRQGAESEHHLNPFFWKLLNSGAPCPPWMRASGKLPQRRERWRARRPASLFLAPEFH